MTLTEEQIAEIRARVEAATPGPWILYGVAFKKPDLDFIKHARDDIPALLSALDAAIERAEKAEKLSERRGERWKDAYAELTTLRARVAELERAAQNLLDRKSWTYKAHNGREMSIEANDGERCWIVHSDDIATLEAAVASGERQDLREHWEAFCDADPFPGSDTFADRMERAGLIECVAVDDEALESPFATERGIEPGGLMWKLTKAGHAALKENSHDKG